MKKSIKIILGLATLWPIFYMVIFFIFTFSQVFILFQGGVSPTSLPSKGFFAIFGLHFLTMLWIFALLIIYIVNVFKNDKVAKDKKALWAVVLILGNMFAMPVYWYLYIWRES